MSRLLYAPALALRLWSCKGASPEEPALIFQGIPQPLRLHVGATQQLAVSVPDMSGNATNIAITYSSSDQTIASVSASGLVTAVKVGDAVITAHAQAAHADIPVHVPGEPLT